MPSDFDFEEEATDAYQGASKTSDEDDEEDEPSVEAELAEQESGLLGDNEKKIVKKKVTEEQPEDGPKSDLDLIEEAEQALELERDELLAKDGDDDEG